MSISNVSAIPVKVSWDSPGNSKRYFQSSLTGCSGFSTDDKEQHIWVLLSAHSAEGRADNDCQRGSEVREGGGKEEGRRGAREGTYLQQPNSSRNVFPYIRIGPYENFIRV